MTDRTIRIAAICAGGLIVVVAAFQIALALGAPFGDATFGGQATAVDGVLSTGFRIIAAINAVILLCLASIVLARARVLDQRLLSPRFTYWATWVIVGYLAINTIANFSAPHPLERWGAGSITLALTILCGVVALRAPAPRA